MVYNNVCYIIFIGRPGYLQVKTEKASLNVKQPYFLWFIYGTVKILIACICWLDVFFCSPKPLEKTKTSDSTLLEGSQSTIEKQQSQLSVGASGTGLSGSRPTSPTPIVPLYDKDLIRMLAEVNFIQGEVQFRYEQPHDKTNKMTRAPSEDSDQPGHPPSLIRVFTVRSMGSWGPNVSSCRQRRLWSHWADAQADLSRLDRCPGWSESSLGTQVILLDCVMRWLIYVSLVHLLFSQWSQYMIFHSFYCTARLPAKKDPAPPP